MQFSMSLRLLLTLSVLQICHPSFASSSKNITVDDSDSSIEYSGKWDVTTEKNSLDYGGYHHYSSSTAATATFTFTGTAVYIMAPLWPYAVGAQASVDGSSSEKISMQDASTSASDTDSGSEDVATSVLWGKTGLSNSSHTLKISFSDTEDYLALDAIVYTVEDSSAQSSTTTSHSSTSSSSGISTSTGSTSSPTSSSDSNLDQEASKVHTTEIVGAVVGAVVGAAFLAVAAAVLIARVRQRGDRYAPLSGAEGQTFASRSLFQQEHPDITQTHVETAVPLLDSSGANHDIVPQYSDHNYNR